MTGDEAGTLANQPTFNRAPAEPTAPTPPTEGAPAAAPTIKVGDADYTPEQLQAAIAAQNNRQDWQRSNTQEAQRLAQERAQLIEQVQGFQQANSEWTGMLEAAAGNPALQQELEALRSKALGQPTATPPGQPTATPSDIPPALAQKIAQIEQRQMAVERTQKARQEAADYQEATAKLDSTFAEYEKVYGQPMPKPVFDNVMKYLNETGSIDPVGAMFAVTRDQLLQQRGQAGQEHLSNAQLGVQNATTQGASPANQNAPIDLSKISQDDADRAGRIAATGQADADYNPYRGT